jgi:CRP/FNR family transcriptional regulator
LRILPDMDWTKGLFATPASVGAFHGLTPQRLPSGMVVFRAGDQAQAFVIVLKGRIEVRLTAVSGREMLLYAVEAGQSCVQTTLGLLGDEVYTGTALTTMETLVVLVPKAVFLSIMDQDKGFRRFVLRAFGTRMNDLTRVLEQVAFAPMEARLAFALLEMAEQALVHAAQAELAARLGTAREVFTRHLQGFAIRGLAQNARGQVVILNEAGLKEVSRGAL